MGVADRPVSFIRGNQIPNDKIKIALHHGAVNQASTDAGFQLTNDLVNTDTFADHAITLLGDIHKPNQTLQEYSCEELEIDEAELDKYLKEGWQCM
jgi:hypothetical protein